MKKPSQHLLRFLVAYSLFSGVYGIHSMDVLQAAPIAASQDTAQAEVQSNQSSGSQDNNSQTSQKESQTNTTAEAADTVVEADTVKAAETADTEKQQAATADSQVNATAEKAAEGQTTTAASHKTDKHQKAKADKGSSSNKTAVVKPKEPVTITADELYVNDVNGDVYAKGNVKIAQATQLMTTDLVNGNTKQQEVWVNGQAAFSDSLTNTQLNTEGIRYNYQTKEGTLDQIKGHVGRDIITGHEALTLNGEIIIHDGTMTRCPAKVPDYHMSADKIEIWPGDKMIAYNAKVWLGSILLYTMPTYTQSLDPNAEQTAYPSISYSNRDGIHIKQKFTQSVTEDLSAYYEMNYYEKLSFKNNGGVKWDQKNYWVEAKAGYYRDSDANWVKKWPEYDFHYKSHRIGDLPITYTFDTIYGKWSDANTTSWHQEYNLYFKRDQIHLNPNTTLDMGTGAGLIKESYNNSIIHNFKYDVTVGHTFNEKWYSWVGYHFTKSETSLFAFDRADMGRELDTGFTYRIDKKNAISFSQSYDLVNKRVYDQDYTWNRDLHCWQLALTYRAKRHEWKWDISLTRW